MVPPLHTTLYTNGHAETKRPPTRPTRTDILSNVLDSLMADVMEWLAASRCLDAASLTEAEIGRAYHQVGGALVRTGTPTTGYRLARSLESVDNWKPDDKLVQILSANKSAHDFWLRKAEEEWVQEHNIQPRYKRGDDITLVRFSMDNGDPLFIRGTVIGLDEKHGYYILRLQDSTIQRKPWETVEQMTATVLAANLLEAT